MMAVRFGLQDVVRLIALKGGDLFEKNFKGDSLLHLAARMDQAEVIGYLLDKGLQTIDVNRDGQRPMDLAVRPAIKQLLSLENPKTHDLFSNQQTYGNKLQARIRTDDLDRKQAAATAQEEEARNLQQ
jgi:ankyrin repeat protein